MKVDEILPHFDIRTFYSRTRIWHQKYNAADTGRDGKDRIAIFTQYNGMGDAGDSSTTGIEVDENHNRIEPGYTARVFSTRPVGSGSDTKFQLVYVYQKGGKDTDGTRLYGTVPKIFGTSALSTDFMFYSVEALNYTCINKDYEIGENQVYVADSDLILKEGVKLTIPDGSVLCVKNGPFYVNGEIECSGTILVEDGGIIMPMESTSGGSRITLKEGGAMIIRSGGRVYAGCPKGSLWTQGDSGWLDMEAGSSIINFGLFIAGQCNFKDGQTTLENHKGGKMFLGYSVENKDEAHFINSSRDADDLQATLEGRTAVYYYYGASKTGGTVHYGSGSNQTVLKVWDGALTMLANKSSDGGQNIKLYSYDKDGKCTIRTDYAP